MSKQMNIFDIKVIYNDLIIYALHGYGYRVI